MEKQIFTERVRERRQDEKRKSERSSQQELTLVVYLPVFVSQQLNQIQVNGFKHEVQPIVVSLLIFAPRFYSNMIYFS